MKKRILSILLCLCMVLAIFPMTAFADDSVDLQNLVENPDKKRQGDAE